MSRSIDEAIEDLKYDIEIDMYIRDIAPQLAEWLEELKKIKSNGRYVQGNKAGQKIGYNKAIDNFTEKIKENISESLIWGMIADCFKYKNMNDTSDKIVDYVIDTVKETAEQLKAGGEN